MRTWRLHDFSTGNPIGPTLKATGSWKQSMTAIGNGTHAVQLRTPALKRYDRAFWQNATAHWVRVLVECWDGQPQYAGLIKHRRMRTSTGEAVLQTVTPNHLLADRYLFGVGDYPGAGPFAIAGASPRSAVERVIKRASGDIGPEWIAPYRYSHLSEGGSFNLTVEKTDWKTAAVLVDTIRKQQGGPDLAFVPVYDSLGRLRWDVLTGQPRVPGLTIDLPMSVRRSRASFVEIGEDGANMGSGIFGRGEGYDRSRLVGLAGYFDGSPDGAPSMIVRDFAIDFQDVKDQDALNSLTAQYLADNTWPVRQWEYDVNVEHRAGLAAFPVGDLKLGTRFKAKYSGDELNDPVKETHYVVGLSHSTDRDELFGVEVQRL